MASLPVIPDSAPFTAEQRHWLNGYLAGLFSGTESRPASPAKTRTRVAVLYASQSGNSENLAESFAAQLGAAGFEAACHSTGDFSPADLAREKHLLLVSSTWGDGDPPDNAVEFWKALRCEDHPRLEGLSYSVLALGDSNYLNFCAQGKAFDERLEALGARRLVPRVDCDTDFEDAAAAWFDSVRSALARDPGGSDAAGPAHSPAALASSPSSSGLTKTSAGAAALSWSKKNPFPGRLLMNRRLNGPGSERDTRHFEIELAGSGLDYEVGDALGVYGQNHPQAVDELTALLAFDGEAPVVRGDGETTSLRRALLEYYDIRTVNRPLLEAWLQVCDSPPLRVLLSPETEATTLENYLWGREIIDLVAEHRPRFAGPADFLALLRKLGPRLYSISSSPKAHPGEVHLTVARVAYESWGRRRFGVCSTHLSDRVYPEGEVRVFVQPAKHFKLPADPDTPVIMVGPGTGIAPFRAFLEERQATGAAGLNWLFFGNPHRDRDFLYREQLESMRDAGVLTRLDTAWSRDQAEKIYVQHRMLEAGAELWKWLEEGAFFYVCGDAKRMARDVDDALHAVVARHGGKSDSGAAAYVAELKKEKRYQRDVY